MRERGTLVSSLVLLGSLAAGSYWLAVRARLGDAQAKPLSHEVDYFAENFTLTRMDDKGAALYAVASKSMTHFADDDSTLLASPEITSVRPNQPILHMRADRGNVTSDGQQVLLTGDVKMVRAASADDPELRGEGSAMVVFPEEDIARSDEPFTFQHGGSSVWARTMEFNNTDRLLRMNEGIEARGTTTIEPQQKKTGAKAADAIAAPSTSGTGATPPGAAPIAQQKAQP